jgi:hypothetical protein
MRRNARSITTSPDIVRNIDGLRQANFNLLTGLIGWLDEHEKQHTKFRMAMINRLTRVEAAVSLILVAQEAQTQSKPPWDMPHKLEEAATQAEEIIARQSEQTATKLFRYIYGEEQAPEPRHDRRRRWWGCVMVSGNRHLTYCKGVRYGRIASTWRDDVVNRAGFRLIDGGAV